jgi:hypothetical protein
MTRIAEIAALAVIEALYLAAAVVVVFLASVVL